jgi:predicted permease
VFTFLLSVLCGLFLGMIPVFKYALFNKDIALNDGGRTSTMSRERHHSRDALVVMQVAMSMVLLVSALLMIRTFQNYRSVDPGFADAAHLQTMRITIPASFIANPTMVTRTQNAIADKLMSVPGVRSVGFASSAPLDAVEPDWDLIYIDGKNYEGKDPPLRLLNYTSPNYFHTMGTRLIAGREFNWDDIYGSRPVAVISENLAREAWGNPSSAIGKRVRQFTSWHQVVGVVEDVHQTGVDKKSPSVVYWPTMMSDYLDADAPGVTRSVTFAIRCDRAGNDGFVNEVQQAVWSVNGDVPLASIHTMQEIYNQSMARTSFALVMLGIAGLMALFLGIIGIYGVISYAVSQRRREIGVRMILGAQKSELQWMFVRSALILTGIGVAIGLGTAAGLTRMMKSLLFGISPMDPFTYVSISLALAAAGMLASYLPARRAASTDPMMALRSE